MTSDNYECSKCGKIEPSVKSYDGGEFGFDDVCRECMQDLETVEQGDDE